jgi:c-src tyrosine kinase
MNQFQPTADWQSLPYFHNDLDREAAERLLQVLDRPGVWLLRPSRSETIIALSQMGTDYRVQHCRIFVHRRERDGALFGFSVDESEVFPNIEALIARLRFSMANATPLMRSRPLSPIERASSVSPAPAPPVPVRQLPPVPLPVSAAVQPQVARSALIDVAELQFGDKLGEGSFGAVYAAKLRGFAVAVKVANESADAVDQEKLQTEARLMASIPPHQNVVRCFGMTAQPNLFVAMQLCSDGSLFDVLQSPQPLRGDWCLKILRDIVAGMAHLHANSIVHRDLAARNVLLDQNCSVALVADFGMSRRMVGGGHRTKDDTAALKWCAPESVRDRVSSQASDVWSFAMLVVEVLTRDVPFPDLEPVRTAIKVAYEGLKPTAPDGSSPAMVRLLADATQTDPRARPTFVQIARFLSAEKSVWRQ